MKKIFFVSLILMQLVALADKDKPNCKINITIEDEQEGRLFFRKLTQGFLDTIDFKKGATTQNIYLAEPTPIYVGDAEGRYQIFFADPNTTITLKLKAKGGLQSTFLEGSKSNEIFRGLLGKQEPIQQFMQKLQKEFAEANANKDSINKVIQYLNGVLRENFFTFLKENGHTEVASYIVFNSVMNDRNAPYKMADTMYQFLSGKGKEGFYGKELLKSMNKLKSVEVGFVAPDFTLTDSSDKKYTLRKIKANYVLLDFWASWCGPCKMEIPYMKKAYEKFHTKGFEIVSVSIDSKKDSWLQALKQFQMPWIHLLEKDRTVSDLYHFPSIPKTLLLDKTGKIIATDLRGEALDQKLNELIK